MHAIKQCLRCGSACTEASIFCENCQLSLLDRSEQNSFQTVPMPCAEIKFLPPTKMIWDDDIDSRPLAMRPLPSVRRRAELRRRRHIFIALALFVIMALIVDGILVTLIFTHSSHKIPRGDAFPLLVLTPDVAYLGQVVHVNTSGKLPGSYNGQIIFSAQGNTGASVKISTQAVSVTLEMLG